MQKKIYPIIEKDLHSALNDKVLKSLDGIAGKVIDPYREVFLSNEEEGYVWCFSNPSYFDSSLLSKIKDGDWKPLSFLASHPRAEDIVKDLREAYNAVPVKFAKFEFKNKFYDPCVMGDLIFGVDPQKYIEVCLAFEGGETMTRSFENVLNKYNIQI